MAKFKIPGANGGGWPKTYNILPIFYLGSIILCVFIHIILCVFDQPIANGVMMAGTRLIGNLKA